MMVAGSTGGCVITRLRKNEIRPINEKRYTCYNFT
jgi:hypothetical protein